MTKINLSVLLGLVIAAFSVDAAVWNDFRVKYDINPIGHFNRQPQLASGAISVGWERLAGGEDDCTNGGAYLGYRYIIPGDNSLILIYDVNGVIAGLQMLLPHAEILTTNNTFRYGDVSYFNNGTFDNIEYFVLTAYIVSPDKICTVGRNESDLITIGTGEGIWIQDGPVVGTYLEIPDLREEALLSGWSNNNCFPGMGTHSWYRMEDYAATNCDEQVPIFGLWSRSMELQGFGFSVAGTKTNPHFENPSSLAVSVIAGAPAPACLMASTDLIGTTTMHVYFIDNPWLATCN